MDVITETSLEALLQRATDCRNKNTDTAAIQAFCGIIKKEAEAPLIASRLIASKLQSAEEWEALQGLTVLEMCMKNCGSAFHSEIGKFRFLNEMIKLVSPKFLGSRTPASVKTQVLRMMHDWTVSYPKEHKIKEAYEMLIKQGVVDKNEMPKEPAVEPQSSSSSQSVSKETTTALFQDKEKVSLLQKLLHSKNPNDLQAANKLIKTMVREDEKRLEMKSKKISEVEHIKNTVRLLYEMLESYMPNASSNEELEIINELNQNCERLRQNVVNLASDVQENDDILCEILSVGDELDQVLKKYKDIVGQKEKVRDGLITPSNSQQISTLLDLSAPVDELVPLTPNNGVSSLSSVNSLMECLENIPREKDKELNPLDSVFSALNIENDSGEPPLLLKQSNPEKLVENTKPIEKSKKVRALEELDVLGKALLQQYKVQALPKKPDDEPILKDPVEQFDGAEKINDNECDKVTSLSNTEVSTNEKSSIESQVLESTKNVDATKSLKDLVVSLADIKPSSIPPFNVIEEKNGISVTIHVAKNVPNKDVTVLVITTQSKNPHPLTDYLFQAVVPKGCKLKLQPPSGSELPAHNPFLPPSAITQIMLISNPEKVSVTLKCMISYTLENETFTEMGEIDQLPAT